MLRGSGREAQEQGEVGEMVDGAKRLGEEQRAKPIQRGTDRANESSKPVPPAPAAGESQMNRTDTVFTV